MEDKLKQSKSQADSGGIDDSGGQPQNMQMADLNRSPTKSNRNLNDDVSQQSNLPRLGNRRSVAQNNFPDNGDSDAYQSNQGLIQKSDKGRSNAKSTASQKSGRTSSKGGNKKDASKNVTVNAFASAGNKVKIGGVYGDDSGDELEMKEYKFTAQELEHVTKLKNEYRVGRSLIHRQRQKREGIAYGELKKSVVDDSFTLGNQITVPKKEDDNTGMQDLKSLKDKPFLELIIISHDNFWYNLWYNLYVFSCLTSSYAYAYMAAFENPAQGSFLFILDNIFEVIFYISFFLNFIVDYQPPDSPTPVKDISKIAMRYIRGQFAYDFIPLVPLTYIDLGGDEKLFYIIKIIRLVIGLQILQVPRIMEHIKKFYQKRLLHIIEFEQVLAEDTNQDNNNISLLIAITNGIKIFRLVLIIFNISYFLGFFWFIFCDLFNRITAERNELLDPVFNNTETFYTYNSLDGNSDLRNAIIVIYYAFTSLSTVGFGDFNPRSNTERLVCSFILLFGVAIFSYIMSIFIDILDKYKDLNADLDDGDSLSKFFGLLRRFNDNVPIKVQLKDQIEKHFDYKWKKDKNQSIDDEKELAMLDQLPEEVQNKIFCDFLFSEFQKLFMRFFRIPRNYEKAHHYGSGQLDPKYHDFYSMEDQEYREFMLYLLTNLEPRQEEPNTMLFEELDEIREVIFIERGECDVGYEINKKKKFVIRYSDSTAIGGYNCTFNKRAIFCYRTKTLCEGYSVRKKNWKNLVDEDNYPNIAKTLKRNVENDYLKNIKVKVLQCKKKHVAKYHGRHDYQQMLTIIPHEALEGQDLNINGQKLGVMENQKTTAGNDEQKQMAAMTSISQQDETDENARQHYQQQQQQSQELVGQILSVIDQKHEENIQMAKQLHQIYEQLTIAKGENGDAELPVE